MKLITRCFILFFLSHLPGETLLGQPQIQFDYISVNEGLSDLTVRSIIQDHVGYLWFGTNNGLNRYDGKEIINYFNDPRCPASLRGNIIYCLFEDSRKNLWVGTWGGGLSLYNRDLDNFTTFTHDPNNPVTIRHNDVWHIYEDTEGNLWIATQKGLERFDYETQTFEKHLSDLSLADESTNLKRKAFSAITRGPDGTLWISIWKHGLLNYDPKNRRVIQHLIHEPGNNNSLSTSEINTLFTDSDGAIWIGTYKGKLEKMELTDGSPVLTKYPIAPAPFGISDYRINFIIEDNHRNIWVGTENGINILNKSTGKTQQYFYNADKNNSLSSNHLWSGYCSPTGIIWIGTLEGGVNVFDAKKRKFTCIFPEINNARELAEKFVKSIYKDSQGYLWVGTDFGLNKFSRQGELIKTFVHGDTQNTLNIGGVSGIVEQSNEILWIGTWGGGLHKLNRSTNILLRYRQPGNTKNPPGIADLNIQTMNSDESGNILLGTSFGHFYIFDPIDDSFTQFLFQDLDSLRGTPITAISPDKNGVVWIGLSENGGLIRLNTKTGQTQRYYHQKENPENSLTSNDIFCLLNDEDHLWIGTKNGLNILNKRTGKVSIFDEILDLKNRSVLSLQKDLEGNIWFSTIQGISKLEVQSGRVFNYDHRDGALGNCHISWKDRNSHLYFGGINGIFSFNPLTISNNSFLPPVIFTSFRIFNEPVFPGIDDSPLQKHINQTGSIVLDYNQTSFSFEFAALNFTLPEKNQYRYILEGFDADWINAGTRNVAYYTNVNPGTYTFKVKGSNNDGLWNEQIREIKVTVLPPWWNTWWFRMLVLIFILVVIASWIIIRTFRLKQQQVILRKKVEERTREIEAQKVILKQQAEKLHEADQLKIRFFTNISHEFRTPLTLIVNPIEKLIKELGNKDEYTFSLSIVKRNTIRLTSLINQFLDISKIEAGAMKLKVAKGNIIEFIQDILVSYEYAARQKNIHLSVKSSRKEHICFFDSDKIEKILHNLLSNSLKFTDTGKNIEVSIDFTSHSGSDKAKTIDSSTEISGLNYVEIKVKDQGSGIPSDKINKIFDRFYQVEGQKFHPGKGSGIGLSLTKDLVDIYRGQIFVQSELNRGTEFTVLLPVEKSLFNKGELIHTKDTLDHTSSRLIDFNDDFSDDPPDREHYDNDCKTPNKNTILVVEDSQDIRIYLSQLLSEKYNIILAHDGEEGLAKAQKHLPQLIISDIMMPQMDGFQLCENIKTGMLTCHIPIILLTAKATSEDRIAGIETGADAYISKPFIDDVLQATIEQLIESRELLKQVFRQNHITQPKEITIESSDEKLLKKIIRILDEKMAESTFGVEDLGKEVGLSRTHLYRKIKEMTGQTAIEFIRNMRLKRAAGMLKENKLYVSEIAYMCGFNELSYFRKIFKELYGISPQKYANSMKEHSAENKNTDLTPATKEN